MRPSDIALLQQIPVAIIARALGLEPGGGLVVAPSTPLLTANVFAGDVTLTPQAMAVRVAGRRVPDFHIIAGQYTGLVVVSGFVFWLVTRWLPRTAWRAVSSSSWVAPTTSAMASTRCSVEG